MCSDWVDEQINNIFYVKYVFVIKIDYNNLYKKSGVYLIENIVSKKKYIGSSKNLYDRLHSHFFRLKYNTHHSCHLQNSYNKYGADVFVYSILEFCEVEYLEEREQYWIDNENPEYNKRIDATRNIGLKCKEETKRKISETLKSKYKNGIISTYCQDHAKIKCDLYDVDTYQKINSFDSLTEMAKYLNVYNRGSSDHLNSVLKNKYVVIKSDDDDFINSINRIKYKVNGGRYLTIEKDGKVMYARNIGDCGNILGVSKNVINRCLSKGIMINGFKIEYQAQYKPI